MVGTDLNGTNLRSILDKTYTLSQFADSGRESAGSLGKSRLRVVASEALASFLQIAGFTRFSLKLAPFGTDLRAVLRMVRE